MQAEIERSDRSFRRFFFWFNFGWMFVSLCSLFFSFVGTVEDHPEYFWDWHGPVIILLALCIPGAFGLLFLIGRLQKEEKSWPPSLLYALSYWSGLYVITTILCLFDHAFVWGYFTVLGMSYGLFQRSRLLTLIGLVFLSYCYFIGALTWPLINSDWASVLGNGITFISLTIVSVTIQYLISERHQRRRLIQQLTETHTELESAHHQLAESALQEQELAVLRERTRLAREMHDTLGHALVLVSVKLEAAQRLRELDPQRCDLELEASKEIIRSSMKELRASIAHLRSPALEREPACRALSRYAREMAQRSDLHVAYDLHPEIEGLPEDIEDTLWKIGQEALTNIEKHAHARNVLLHISRQESQIFLKIEDDGIGLPENLCQQQEHTTEVRDINSPLGHYGLSGMLERVKEVQGQLSIHPASAGGTAIEVTLPLVEAPRAALSPVIEPARSERKSAPVPGCQPGWLVSN